MLDSKLSATESASASKMSAISLLKFPFKLTKDPKSITSMLRIGGRSAGLAKTWFAVKERKNLIKCAKNKLLAAVDIIATKHSSERIMVFSETIESVQKPMEMLQNKGIKSMLIDSKLNSKKDNTIRMGKGILSIAFGTHFRNRV